MATVIAVQLPDTIAEGTEASSNREPRELYSGLLHYVVFATGTLVLLMAVALGLPTMNALLTLVTSCGMLAIFFALAGATFRSQLGSYLSLASLGWMVVQVTVLVEDQWGPPVAMIAAACSMLGLVLMTIAAINSPVGSHQVESRPSRKLLPTAWSSPPLPLRADFWSSLWFNPLRQAALLFAQVGVTIVVANIAWTGSWGGWSVLALVTLIFAAISCAIASKLYDTSILTYIAAVLFAVGVFPLLPSFQEGDPRLGVVWSLIAVAFWIVGYGIERLSVVASAAETDHPSDFPLTRIYERPLIRSSAVLAIIAICQSLYAWILSSDTAALTPLLMASAAGTLSLLLNARSMNVLHRFSLGRMLVYLACLAITGCCLIVASTRWGLEAIGPNAAVTALFLSALGLVLMEWVRWRSTAKPDAAAAMLTFANPLSNYGAALAMVASLVSVVIAIGTSGYDGGQTLVTSIAGWLDSLPIGPVCAHVLDCRGGESAHGPSISRRNLAGRGSGAGQFRPAVIGKRHDELVDCHVYFGCPRLDEWPRRHRAPGAMGNTSHRVVVRAYRRRLRAIVFPMAGGGRDWLLDAPNSLSPTDFAGRGPNGSRLELAAEWTSLWLSVLPYHVPATKGDTAASTGCKYRGGHFWSLFGSWLGHHTGRCFVGHGIRLGDGCDSIQSPDWPASLVVYFDCR